MKIAIVTAYIPFMEHDTDVLAEQLKEQLQQLQHEVVIIKLPFQEKGLDGALESILAYKLVKIDVFNTIDKVITLSFPAYHIQHPRKVLWLFDQFHPLHDKTSQTIDSPEEQCIQEAINYSDSQSLQDIATIYASSPTIQERLKLNTLEVSLLSPALDQSAKQSAWSAILENLLK